MNKAEIFEDFFIDVVTRKIEEAKISHSEFGRRVYQSESGPRLWRATREKERKRSTSVGEAYMMAEALGLDYPALIWEVVQEGKSRGVLT